MTALAGAVSIAAAAPAPQGYPGTATTIRINSDAQLRSAALQNHWTGTGTLSNPYVIAGNATTHNLDMKGGAFGIYIANITSRYFKVQDWHIFNSSSGVALTIKNVNTPFLVTNLTINNVMNGVIINKTADNSAVRKVTLNNIGMDGIQVGNSTRFYIENNNVNNATHAIKTFYCTRSFVRNNVLTDGQGSISVHAFVSGVAIIRTTWTTVSNNSFSDINVAIHPQWAYNNTIELNRIVHCAEGIYLDQSSVYNVVQTNSIKNMTERAIALNFDATQNTVAFNTITNCSWGGIYSARSVRANIHDNLITLTGIGIDMTTHSNNAQIVNNRIEGSIIGITLIQSNLTTVTGNHVANSTLLAIPIPRPELLGANGAGIILRDTNGNTVVNNYFYQNPGYGIRANNCTTSSFDLNLMSGNHGATTVYNAAHVQAYDNRTTNSWNTGSLGNYWNDRTTPDANGNSIVDVPYAIDGVGSRSDNFPLAFPVGMVNNLQGSAGLLYASLTWQKENYSASGPLTNYEVKRNGTHLAFVAPTILKYNDTTVGSGQSYTYSVIARNLNGQSGARNKSLTIPLLNVPLVNITSPLDGALLNSATVNVTWVGFGSGFAITGYTYKLNNGAWTSNGMQTYHVFTAAQGIHEGLNTVSVNITNSNAKSSTSSIQFTVDLTSPLVTITSPLNGYLNTTGVVGFTWNGVDANGISQYMLRIASGSWQNQGLSTSATLNLNDGNLLISVMAIDAAGNSGIATVNVTVDTTRPQITNMSPASGSYVNASAVTFSWDIIEAGSGVNRTNVSVDSGPVVNIRYNTSYTTDLLSQGWHIFDMIVYDNASFNSSISVQFFVDSVAPTLSIDSPLDGSVYSTGNINLTWSVNGTGTSITSVQYSLNAASWSSVPNLGYKLLSLADGNYSLQMRAFDQANNSAMAQSNFTVDTVAPTLSIVDPANGTYLNTSSVLVRWNMSDSTSGIAQVWLALDNGSASPIGVVNQTSVPIPADGWHTVHLQVQDQANNSAWANVTFFVDTHDPVVGIITPPDGAFIDNVNVTMVYAGTDSFVPSSGVQYFEVRYDATAWVNNGANNAFTFVGLSQGPHTLYVRAVDQAGNFAIASADITVDTVNPTVSIDYPADGARFNVDHLIMNWTFDDFSPAQGFNVSTDGINWTSVGTNTSYEFTDLSQGTNVLWLQATDMTNHTSLTSVTVVVDTQAPWIQFVEPTAGQIFATDTILTEWNVTDNTTGVLAIWIWLDGVQQANITAEQNYSFAGLSEGEHVIGIQAWDQLLNQQVVSITVKVDTIAPLIVITQPTQDQYLNTRNVTLAFTVNDGPNGSGVAENLYAVDADVYQSLGTNTTTVLKDLGQGAHSVHVRSVDLAGNVRTAQRNFTVDTAAPTVVGSNPAGRAVNVTDAISVLFSEAMDQATVHFDVNGVSVAPTTWVGNLATYTHAVPLLYAKNYSVTVSGKDLAGNDVSGSRKTFSFATKCMVSGTVKDSNGNPIANATVTLKSGSTTVATGQTNANGQIALVVPEGSYNLTISASGKKDFTKAVVVAVGTTNVLEPVSMQNLDNWTWLYILIVIVVIAAIVLFLYMRKKGGAKPAEGPKTDAKTQAPKAAETPKK